MDRYQRSLRRASEVSETSIRVQPTEEVGDMDIDVTEVKSYNDMCVGTDLTIRDIEEMQNLNSSYKDQVTSLQSKVQTLTCERKQLKSDVDLKDDQTIHFYTGLRSSKVFFALLTYLTTAWSPRTLSPPTPLQFYLVLMKLRLGLTHKDLAYSILRQTLPINLVKRRRKDTVATVDKILLVCSALSNLDKSLVQ
ncbi:hypothetical protein DPX16_0641 [Anabarilius grahami]|uniref:Uncharacterized protein n=1 Tax=Anabarilius grahami TaxID=495550 RepID=A0A3N0XUA2_ANAGA|nr:hypothetical protein DPX16_0641 [Anabarilius grahami]